MKNTLPAAADPLKELKDIHLPPAPSWWPPAIGWWIGAGLLLLALFLLWRAWSRQRARNQARRLALRELEEIRPFSRVGATAADKRRLLEELSALLRRFCRAQWPEKDISSLHGALWLDFLLEQIAEESERHKLANQLSVLLQLYAPDRALEQMEIDPVALKECVRKWFDKIRHRN